MRLPGGVSENLHFLCAEARTQVESLAPLLKSGRSADAGRIIDRRGYAYNLKMRVHERSVAAIRQLGAKNRSEIFALRAAEAIASELERFVDLGYDCALQATRGPLPGPKAPRAIRGMLGDLSAALGHVEDGLKDADTTRPLKIGKLMERLRTKHLALNREQTEALRTAGNSAAVLSMLILSHKIKDMAELMAEIADAMISATLAQPMRVDRFRFLEAAIADLNVDQAEVAPVAETRSGSGVSRIAPAAADGRSAIFKDGKKHKLKEERESVENWHEIFPGVAPRILSYRKRGDQASMLIEHLPGTTFENLLLQKNKKMLLKAERRLEKTLKAIWQQTRQPAPAPAGHMRQLRKRLPEVIRIHNGFDSGRQAICGARTRSLADLIDRCEAVEAAAPPPFSVFIHGDFNVDNIIYDQDENKIRFIDLHRSKRLDYSQDISVFMVSNYRLQVLDRETRRRIRQVATRIHDFALKFAARQGDRTAETRIALGLARSFITSTRFTLDRSHARAMFMRAIYILERLADHDAGPAGEFRLPIEELF